MNIHPTAYAELGYGEAPDGTWRVVYRRPGSAPPCLVGPVFPTRDALLAGLPAYAASDWGYPEPTPLDAGTRDLVSRLGWALETFAVAETLRRAGGRPCQALLDVVLEEVDALRPMVSRATLGTPQQPPQAPPTSRLGAWIRGLVKA